MSGTPKTLSDDERQRRRIAAASIYSKLTDEQKAARVQKMLETKRLKASIKN